MITIPLTIKCSPLLPSFALEPLTARQCVCAVAHRTPTPETELPLVCSSRSRSKNTHKRFVWRCCGLLKLVGLETKRRGPFTWRERIDRSREGGDEAKPRKSGEIWCLWKLSKTYLFRKLMFCRIIWHKSDNKETISWRLNKVFV